MVISGLSPGLYRFCRFLAGQTFQRLYRLQVQGLEHLPSQGPVILCPKHQRWEDIPVVGLALTRPLYYIAKVELFRRPLVREFLQSLGGIPLDREAPKATLSSFRALPPLLKQGAAIVVFPEGTYVRHGVGAGKHRLLQLLLKLKSVNGLRPLPFVPVGIVYRPRPPGYDVCVRVGAPLTVPAARQAMSLTRALMEQIARLCAEASRG
jgi:1-acyl-sn-glycerol-3-phosphate acyltransferase